ncbi:MAG: SDR family NAD(P)-dependent oxidoreductase, partial [Planctomycetaceae bacterium]|nr:SDR family NAD(P)-dependent oxidoreductase [Planctomycetaceae bacterium]
GLVKAGAKVVIADLNPPAETALEELGDSVRFEKTDVREETDVRKAIETADHTFGNVRGAMICAGIIHAERTVNKTGAFNLEAFRRVIDVNLIGTFNVARLVAEHLSKTEPQDHDERGVIIMTSSVAAFDGQIGQAAYSASKGGVASLALPLARDLSKFGIRVVAIAPGVFETPMMAAISDEYRKSLTENVPFPYRLGQPDEFAALARHIIENPYLNGETIRLDAALRMSPR